MGSTYGLKIKKIGKNNILKEINFSEGRIIEYIYYITKLNKFYIENVKKNILIKEFTIFNIFTKKEYNIIIEMVESGYFFDDIEYIVEEIPKFKSFLLVTKIIENSPAYGILNEGECFLIGYPDRYLNNFRELEDSIRDTNSLYLFYNLIDDKIVEISFEKGDSFSMGIEFAEINEISALRLISEKKKCNLSKSILINNTKESYNNKHEFNINDSCNIQKLNLENVNYDNPANKLQIDELYNEIKINNVQNDNKIEEVFISNKFDESCNQMNNESDILIEHDPINIEIETDITQNLNIKMHTEIHSSQDLFQNTHNDEMEKEEINLSILNEKNDIIQKSVIISPVKIKGYYLVTPNTNFNLLSINQLDKNTFNFN